MDNYNVSLKLDDLLTDLICQQIALQAEVAAQSSFLKALAKFCLEDKYQQTIEQYEKVLATETERLKQDNIIYGKIIDMKAKNELSDIVGIKWSVD